MCIRTRAPRGYAHGFNAAVPSPLFNMRAEEAANSTAAETVADDKSTDEGKGFGLEMALDGDFDPSYDFDGNNFGGDEFILDAGDEGSLF